MTNLFDDILTEVQPSEHTMDKSNTPTSTDTQQQPEEKIFSVSEFSILLKTVLEGTFKKIKIKSGHSVPDRPAMIFVGILSIYLFILIVILKFLMFVCTMSCGEIFFFRC